MAITLAQVKYFPTLWDPSDKITVCAIAGGWTARKMPVNMVDSHAPTNTPGKMGSWSMEIAAPTPKQMACANRIDRGCELGALGVNTSSAQVALKGPTIALIPET